MYKLPEIPMPPVEEGPGGARKRLAKVLEVLRSPDVPGSFSAIAEDHEIVDLLVQWPGEGPESLWQQLVERLHLLARAQRCLRCGTCCRVSSPTLYIDDVETIRSGRIPKRSLFTLRVGEKAHSARLGESIILEQELIKLKERSTGGCLNLDDHLCRDYDHRPLQCRNLECWSGQHAGALEDRQRLRRQDLYEGDETALQLIEEFEAKLPAHQLRESLEKAVEGDETATMTALEFIERDHRLRKAIAERYGYSDSEQELLFGREALEIVRSHGLVLDLNDLENPRIKRPKISPKNSCSNC